MAPRAEATLGTGGALLLHARRLAFDHPDSGERVVVAAPLPPAIAEAAARVVARGGGGHGGGGGANGERGEDAAARLERLLGTPAAGT